MQALPTRRHARSIAWCILRQRPTGNGGHGRRDSSAAVVEGLGRVVSGETRERLSVSGAGLGGSPQQSGSPPTSQRSLLSAQRFRGKRTGVDGRGQ